MGTNHLQNSSGEFEKIKTYSKNDIAEDVLERLEGLQDFQSIEDLNRVDIFRLRTLNQALDDEETNEDTKFLIREIMEDCIGFNFLMIIY